MYERLALIFLNVACMDVGKGKGPDFLTNVYEREVTFIVKISVTIFLSLPILNGFECEMHFL